MNLPVEFSDLEKSVDNVRKKGRNEWSSSCPSCGGVDRFIYLTNATGKNKTYAFCRQCGYQYIPNNNNHEIKFAKRETSLAKKIVDDIYIRNHNDTGLWEKYHAEMGDYIGYWYLRGVDDDTINYYKLGFCRDYYGAGAALTIPVFDFDWRCVQMYYRLFRPTNGDKYKQTASLPPAVFYTDMDFSEYKDVFWVEGQIKAIVVNDMILKSEGSEKFAGMYKDMMVIGMPSSQPSDDLISKLKQAERIYLSLDPDTYLPGKNGVVSHDRLVGRIKKIIPHAKIHDVSFSRKIDDMIVDGELDIKTFSRILKLSAII